ncbi:hypothetical protein QX776_12205 [Alteromonadaceae bacterium BrNp21-10]|nr:hypothetical protein [Alteromonadaceae bacterium BrNp21-10]
MRRKTNLSARRLISHDRRRIAMKRAHRKMNLRRQFFQNREIFSEEDKG